MLFGNYPDKALQWSFFFTVDLQNQKIGITVNEQLLQMTVEQR